MARAVASADRARGDARVIYWADELTTCPDCGATHAPANINARDQRFDERMDVTLQKQGDAWFIIGLRKR